LVKSGSAAVPHHARFHYGADLEADGAAPFDHREARPAQNVFQFHAIALHLGDVEQAAVAGGDAGQGHAPVGVD